MIVVIVVIVATGAAVVEIVRERAAGIVRAAATTGLAPIARGAGAPIVAHVAMRATAAMRAATAPRARSAELPRCERSACDPVGRIAMR